MASENAETITSSQEQSAESATAVAAQPNGAKPGKSRATKILIGIAVAVIALLAIAVIGVSNYLVDYAIGRAGDGGDRNVEEVVIEAEGTEARIEANRVAEAAKTSEFLNAVPGEPVEIAATDGIVLAGIVYEHEGARVLAGTADSTLPASIDEAAAQDDLWAIVIHGYRNTNQSDFVLDMARHYYDAGFNVLTPDLRASGNSEGDFVGMGWLDRIDILDWVDWILQQNANAQIVIHGVSMGAATTMMVAGEETPAAVVAFVEDCGYTSVWDVFGTELSRRFGLPEFPLLYSASALSSARAGYSFEEASALEAVARSEKPMLFIHGTADDFIPFDMMGQLYDAKVQGDKEVLVSEGAGHAEAMYELSDAYWETVFDFEGRYIKG